MSGDQRPHPNGPAQGAVLAGRRVIVTRSVADNRSLAQTLGELGAEVIEMPLTVVLAPVDGGAALRIAAGRLSDYRWVVFTSVNAVEALSAAIAATTRSSPKSSTQSSTQSSTESSTEFSTGLDQVVAVPVGPTTAAAARAHGFTVADPPSEATAAALVEAFPPATAPGLDVGLPGRGVGPPLAGDRILAPLAELASDTVVAGLEAKGYRIDRVTAYRTAAPPAGPTARVGDAERTAGADAVTFFSPSAVDRFVDRFSDRSADRFSDRFTDRFTDRIADGPGLAVCIGPSTAARATERGLNGVVMASPHSESGVVEQLIRALGSG